LHAVEQQAVAVRNSSDNIELRAISARAGVRVGTRFTLGTDGSPSPLILLQNATNVALATLTLEPVARPAISVLDSDFVRMSELTAVGLAVTTFVPAPVMIQVSGAKELEITDSILSAFG